jgi:hypothetical protein
MMKIRSILFLLAMVLAAALRAEQAAQPAPAAAAPAPMASRSQDTAQIVEDRFQAARAAYLAGDRDTALRNLNEALRLDPYHVGSTKLYETIRDEERALRQVRLGAQAQADAAAQAQAAGPQASGPSKFWQGLMHFESRTERRLDSMEKGAGELNSEMGLIHAEVSGQK